MIIDRHHCSPGLHIKFLLCLYWICLDLALDCQVPYFTRHITKFFIFIAVIKMCLRPTLVYTNMKMSLKSVPLVWNTFWQTTERNVWLHQYFRCVFTVRHVVSVVMPCSFTCDYQRHGGTWNLKTSVTMASSPEYRNHGSGDWSPIFHRGG